MNTAIHRQEDGTIELTITIPWADIEKTYEHVVSKIVERTELPGFRKGKAPRTMVEEKLDRSETYEEVLKQVIPEFYGKAVTAEKLHPVVTPKIELKEATEKKDWIIKAITAEKPELTLGEYKKALKDLKATKAKKIWLPGSGQGKVEPKEEEKKEEAKPTLDELLQALYSAIKIALPSILLEHEVNRLLSDLIDQTKRLGLSVEQYLSSTGRTAESVRKEYENQARRTLTLEFALEKIADTEGILVSDDDIDTVIKTAKTDEEKKSLENQRYYIASVLRRQKTLDFLSAL